MDIQNYPSVLMSVGCDSAHELVSEQASAQIGHAGALELLKSPAVRHISALASALAYRLEATSLSSSKSMCSWHRGCRVAGWDAREELVGGRRNRDGREEYRGKGRSWIRFDG